MSKNYDSKLFTSSEEKFLDNPKNPPTPARRPAIRAALETAIGYAQTRAEQAELDVVIRSLAAAGATGDEVRRRVAAWPRTWEPPTWKSIEKKWTFLGEKADYAEKPYPGLLGSHEEPPIETQPLGEFLADNDVSSLRELLRRKS